MKIKCLSVRQPWAWLILNGYKTIENRTWRVNDRGPILIHAGKQFDYSALRFMCQPNQPELIAAGRAVIERFGIRGNEKPEITRGKEIMGAITGYACLTGTDSVMDGNPWAERGVYHWYLEKGHEMKKPEPLLGRLGLYQYYWMPDEDFVAWREECEKCFADFKNPHKRCCKLDLSGFDVFELAKATGISLESLVNMQKKKDRNQISRDYYKRITAVIEDGHVKLPPEPEDTRSWNEIGRMFGGWKNGD